MPILLLVLGGLALFALASDDDGSAIAPPADCYEGLEPEQAAIAQWLLTAPAGFVIPGLGEEGWGGDAISSDLLIRGAAEAEQGGHLKLADCLRKRAAVLKNQGH